MSSEVCTLCLLQQRHTDTPAPGGGGGGGEGQLASLVVGHKGGPASRGSRGRGRPRGPSGRSPGRLWSSCGAGGAGHVLLLGGLEFAAAAAAVLLLLLRSVPFLRLSVRQSVSLLFLSVAARRGDKIRETLGI